MCALYRYIHNEFDRERLFPPLDCPHTHLNRQPRGLLWRVREWASSVHHTLFQFSRH